MYTHTHIQLTRYRWQHHWRLQQFAAKDWISGITFRRADIYSASQHCMQYLNLAPSGSRPTTEVANCVCFHFQCYCMHERTPRSVHRRCQLSHNVILPSHGAVSGGWDAKRRYRRCQNDGHAAPQVTSCKQIATLQTQGQPLLGSTATTGRSQIK